MILYLVGAVLVGTALLLLGRAFWIRAGLTWARVAIAVAIGAVTFGIIALVVSGKLPLLFAAVAAVVAFGSRLMSVLSVLPILNKLFPNWHRRFRRGAIHGRARGGSANGSDYATIETPELKMTLHHGTGHMDGEILFGAERGRFLSELDRHALTAVLSAMTDAESRRLLSAYLERVHGGGSAAGEAVPSAGMSAEQALEVLGLAAGASRDEIVLAHRRLIQKLHPDRGGSTYLATQLNEAKRVLIGD